MICQSLSRLAFCSFGRTFGCQSFPSFTYLTTMMYSHIFHLPNLSFWRIRISAMTVCGLNPPIYAMNYKLCTLISADLSASIYGFLFSRKVAAGALSPATFYIPAAIGIVNDMMRRTSHRITPCVRRDSRLHSRPRRNRFSSPEQLPQPRLHSSLHTVCYEC